MNTEIKNWWQQAQADLRSAKNCIQAGDFYLSVFASQQAAEKGLKALYILLKQKLPPKMHDLVELCRLTKAPEGVAVIAGKLTSVYLPSHYPGVAPSIPAKYYDKEKALRHRKEAEEILRWVKKQIR